jgi:hypothetical protein
MENSDQLILLGSHDNVLIARKEIVQGNTVVIDGTEIVLTQTIKLGFKIASRSIHLGEKIIKYGIPIGSAKAIIEKGELIHVHNMKSDYSPTYTIENQSDYRE